MKALLLVNGEPPKQPINTQNFDAFYCTDGAWKKAQLLGMQPDAVVGDFDSLPEIHTLQTEIIHRPDQNFTDFEKTLQLLHERGFTQVEVYGASGQEQDHFLGNLTAAFHYKNHLRITFHDEHSTYFFCEKQTFLSQVKNRMISLYPFPTAKNVHSKGLFYPLNGLDLNILTRIGTRNHASEDHVSISFESGELLVFIGGEKIHS